MVNKLEESKAAIESLNNDPLRGCCLELPSGNGSFSTLPGNCGSSISVRGLSAIMMTPLGCCCDAQRRPYAIIDKCSMRSPHCYSTTPCTRLHRGNSLRCLFNFSCESSSMAQIKSPSHSVRILLSKDFIAQIRRSNAAQLIANSLLTTCSPTRNIPCCVTVYG